MDSGDDDLLAVGGLSLGRRAVAAAAPEPIETPLGHRQVGQDEFQVEPLQVAGRVDAAVGVRVGGVVERPDDMQQRIGIAQPGKVVRWQLLGADMPLGRWRRRRHVHVGDIRLDDPLRLEDRGERSQARIGHLDHAHVEGDPAVAAGLSVAPSQGIEDGRLARTGKPDDGSLHGCDGNGDEVLEMPAPVNSRRRGPRC